MLGILLDNDVDNDDNDVDNADVFNGEKANDDNGDCPNPPVTKTVQLLLYFYPNYSTKLVKITPKHCKSSRFHARRFKQTKLVFFGKRRQWLVNGHWSNCY